MLIQHLNHQTRTLLATAKTSKPTLRSLSGPFVDLMLSFCSSCTMSPQKRLKVRGMRTLGLTCSNTEQHSAKQHVQGLRQPAGFRLTSCCVMLQHEGRPCNTASAAAGRRPPA